MSGTIYSAFLLLSTIFFALLSSLQNRRSSRSLAGLLPPQALIRLGGLQILLPSTISLPTEGLVPVRFSCAKLKAAKQMINDLKNRKIVVTKAFSADFAVLRDEKSSYAMAGLSGAGWTISSRR